MATEQLTIEALIEGADTTAIQRMRNELDNLGKSGKQAGGAATQGMSQLDRGLGRVMDTMKGVLAAYGVVFSAQRIVSFAQSSVQAFLEQEQATARLRAGTRLLGIEWQRVTEDVDTYTTALQKNTAFSRDEQTQALGTLINLTHDYALSIRALPTVLDLAAASGVDLNTAARALSLTLQGIPGRLPAIRVALQGMKLEAMSSAEILEVVSKRVSGSAEEMADTIGGRFKNIRNIINNFKEDLGSALSEKLVLPLTEVPAGGINLINQILGGGTGFQAKDPLAGLAALRRFQDKRSQGTGLSEDLRKDIERLNKMADITHILEPMRGMSKLAQERYLVEQDIRKELEKGGNAYEGMVEKARKIIEINKQEKDIRKEINELMARQSMVGLEFADALVSAAEEIQSKFPDSLFGGQEIAPGLTLRQATQKKEGISGFSQFRENMLRDVLARPRLPQAFRAETAQQLFQENLSQARAATTPFMAQRQFGEAVEASQEAMRERVAQLQEEIDDRKALVKNSQRQIDELRQIRSVLERIASTANIGRARGFEAMARNDLE